MTEDNDRAGQPSAGTESRFTVLLALGANLGIAILKLVAGLLSGSGALLSEAAHSAGDCSTELLAADGVVPVQSGGGP